MAPAIFDLTGRVALVSGGAQGIGRAMAIALAEAGADLVLADTNTTGVQKTAEQITALGRRALPVTCDVAEPAQIRALFTQVDREFGRIDVLGNVAGEAKRGRPEAISLHDVEWTWRNLVYGRFCCCQEAGRRMLAAGRGSIINIASMSAILPLSRVVAYSAAKAAVLNLTKFLAREWATRGVRVNAISPGFFPADQNRAMLFNPDGGYTERGRQIIGHTPMARMGEAHELAGAVVWLAAPRASSFVTGQNIVVDGGFSSVTI